jgi:tol-pal system protein YbgF
MSVMKLRALLFALLVFAAATAARPAAAADKETRQMMADIRMLQEQEQQIQNTLAAITEALKAADARVAAKFDEQAEATRKGFADERTITSSISSDVRAVRERLDDNTTSLGKMMVEVQALRQLITSRSTLAVPDTTAPDIAGSGASAVAPSQSALGASPTALFDQAMGDYSAGQYDLAIDGFKAFINSFPTAPQAADAQVRICNSFINSRKYSEAVDACDTAIRNYPKSTVAPDAWYRKGLALKELRQPELARAAFQFVVSTWPDSQAATLASQNLPADPKRP